jgi:hypothetical protein
MKGALRRGTIVASLLMLIALFVEASTAKAARAPTPTERAALIRGLAMDGIDRCEIVRLRVSTSPRGWATFAFGYAPGENYESCNPNVPSGLGFVKHTKGGAWKLTAVASDVTCGQKGLPPVPVQRDLGTICHFDYPGRCEWKGRSPRFVAGIDELAAEGIGCGRARALVRAYHAKSARIRVNPGRVGPFRCKDEFTHGGLYVTCTRRPVRRPFRQVRWFAYVRAG